MWDRHSVMLGLVVLSGCAAGAGDARTSSQANPATDGADAADGSSQSGADGDVRDVPPVRGDDDDSAGADESGSSMDAAAVCNEYAVRNQHATPNMLIVLDKSASMAPDNNDEGVDRWEGSVAGVKTFTADLDDVIRFGLMTFPGDGDCGAGNLDVEVGPHNAYHIATKLDGTSPMGNTPTTASLEAAHRLLASAPIDPDAPPSAHYVVLVTDGDPNCRAGDLSAILACGANLACVQMVAEEAGKEAIAEIEAMAQDGIKTYVLGYQTQGSQALDGMARAGDTGDARHRAVEDEAALLEEFRRIATRAVDCDFILEEAPSDPSYVLVEIDGQQLNLDAPSGWALSQDGKRVSVQGSACESLQDGGEHVLSVKVLCEVVTPI